MSTPGTGPYWHVVTPRAAGNLIANPSFEFGTAGWSGTGASVVLGTVSDAQAFGAWSLRATTIADGRGASVSATLGSGTAYAASAYVRIDAASGGSVQLSFGGTTSRVPVGSAWHRVGVGTLATATAARTLAVQAWGASGGTLYVDGVQVEDSGAPSTYIDGDQPGCQWLGAPHASASARSGRSRAGGSISRLADLGMTVDESPGIGAPPLVTIMQPYALADGSEFQRQRAAARPFSLVSQIVGTSWSGLHATRERIIDALKPDLTPQAEPTVLLYAGAGGTAQIGAVWSGGLEFGEPDGFAEPAAVAKFEAPDPYWYSQRQDGTTLAPYTTFGSVNFIAYRDPEGRWGTMGPSGSSVQGGAGVTISSIVAREGTLFAGGVFVLAGGTPAHSLARYSAGAWGTLVGGQIGTGAGTASTTVNELFDNGAGTLFFGGNWDTLAGTSYRYVGLWTAAGFGTLASGTPTNIVNAMARDPSTGAIYVGGNISGGVGGTAGARYIARWGGAWGTLAGGTVDAYVTALLTTPAGTLWAFGSFASVAGTTARRAAFWAGGSWGTPAGETASQPLTAGAIDAQQRIYAGGGYTSGYPRVYQPGGIGTLAGIEWTAISGAISQIVPTPDGQLWICGNSLALSGIGLPSSGFDLFRWNGYTWLPADLIVPGASKPVTCIARSVDGTIYAGGGFSGAGTTASVARVVNRGAAATYPTLRLRNLGAGTARVYQLLNTTGGTETGLWFNYVMAPGEVAQLTLTPGARAFTSSSQGNVLGRILGGSNLSAWRLHPGTNTVTFLADGAGVEASLYWPVRSWSADADQ